MVFNVESYSLKKTVFWLFCSDLNSQICTLLICIFIVYLNVHIEIDRWRALVLALTESERLLLNGTIDTTKQRFMWVHVNLRERKNFQRNLRYSECSRKTVKQFKKAIQDPSSTSSVQNVHCLLKTTGDRQLSLLKLFFLIRLY